MMNINEFIKNNLKVTSYSTDPSMSHMLTSTRLPKIVCEDGFEMSVQVGFSLYSTPKKVAKRYSAVEIGFPSAPEPLIAEYAEDWEIENDDDSRLCETVYGYVPVGVVDKVLKKHGGINLTQTLLEGE